MSAHEWTRARQRSVRRDAQPPVVGPVEPPPSAEPPPPPEPPQTAEPEQPADGALPAPEVGAEETAFEAPAEVGELPPDEVTLDTVPFAEVEAPAPPAAAVEPRPRPPRRRRPARPAARQAELPLGLDPVTEAAAKRSATETREELIERLLDPHLSLQETAKLLDVCPTTVRRYTNRGLLAHYRTPGNQRRFRLSDVLAFMERQGIPAQGLERKRTELWRESGPADDANS
jgi:excisionase family DNA binding protein